MTDEELKSQIAAQKGLMIAVATGGPRIPSVNVAYVERRTTIAEALARRQLADPNPFDDLWGWYGRWQETDLQHYQQRRLFVGAIYKSTLDQINSGQRKTSLERIVEPTGWERVDRALETTLNRFDAAQNEEDFQGLGLLCREVIISLGQAVYDPLIHTSSDGLKPSDTDANRMLDGFISYELRGASNEALRRHAKASLGLAVELQHRRTAQYRDAALCIEATTSLVNFIAIVSGRRDLHISPRPHPKKNEIDDRISALDKLLYGEHVDTRLRRILKLLNANRSVFERFTRVGSDGKEVQYTIPGHQGGFSLYSLQPGEQTREFWYINTIAGAANISKAMADLRVLLSECSRGQDVGCKFILVTDEELGAEKSVAYKTFEKMIAAVPLDSRRLFAFEVWDEPILRGKESELLLRTDD